MGVKIVKNTFKKRLGNLDRNTKMRMLKQLRVQIKADSSRNYTKEEYADESGNIKKWKPFKQSTLYRENKSGKKVWNKRPSGKKYTPRSKLLQDTGRLWKSLGGGTTATIENRSDLDKLTKRYVEIGSKIKYADYQHGMRPILTISKITRKKLNSVGRRFLRGEYK